MTTAEARKAGYEVCRGRGDQQYKGYGDDINRWYIDPIDCIGNPVDRWWSEYYTRREALDKLESLLAFAPWLDRRNDSEEKAEGMNTEGQGKDDTLETG